MWFGRAAQQANAADARLLRGAAAFAASRRPTASSGLVARLRPRDL